MIVVSNTTAQTLNPGQSITFDNIVWLSPKCGPRNEFFRSGTSAVRTAPGVYEVSFSGNIGGTVAATPVQLAIAVDGSALPTTTMVQTPPSIAAGDYFNVHADTIVGVPPLSGASFTVTNTGTSVVTIAPNASLKIVRKG